MQYWEKNSRPTTAQRPLVRIPAAPGANWEYVQLQDDLHSLGWVSAEIMRPNSAGVLEGNGSYISLYDQILPGGTYLAATTIVKASCNSATGVWFLDDWTAART